MGKGDPNKPRGKMSSTPSSCRPAARSTRRSTPTPQSISQSFPRNVPRDGRPCRILLHTVPRARVKREKRALAGRQAPRRRMNQKMRRKRMKMRKRKRKMRN
ncbi:unnamed protein product, partial [Rangifer tarandus platyrhynchus]